MKELAIETFLEKTASEEAVPGGGSVSALCGALGAALSKMVTALTISKAGYEEVNEEMSLLGKKAATLMEKLSGDIKKDSEAFELVMRAIKLPKESDSEKVFREEEIQKAYKIAAEVPLNVAKDCCHILEIAGIIAAKGNENAVTDSLVAAMCARTGGLGALYNVWINLDAIKNEEYVAWMKKEVYLLGECLIDMERRILSGYSLTFRA